MQPYFLPYLGYFQLMAAVDKFVFLDDVNYLKGGWLNRNRIRSFGKIQWLTIPLAGASPNKLICDIDNQIDEKFSKKTLKVIEGAYQKSPNYTDGIELIRQILSLPSRNLADFARDSLLLAKGYLSLSCEIVPSSKIYENNELKGEDRVLDICQRETATVYVNLPGGKSIYSRDRFEALGMELKFVDPQLPEYGVDFEPGLSILDVIMNNTAEDVRGMAQDAVLTC